MHPDYHIAEAIQRERLALRDRHESRRRRTADSRAPSTSVIDALGHGLIALGARLVSDPDRHVHDERRAA